MRRQIEEMQEKALEGRSIAEAMLVEVLAGVVESSSRSEEMLNHNTFGAEEPGNASPAYEPPASPEYIPPQDNMETEVSETPRCFKCSICGLSVEGVIFELFEHLEEKHGMEDAEEEELEKCCIPIGSKQDEVSAQESSFAVSKKPEEGVEEQLETGGETENKEVDDGAEMDNETGADKEEVIDKEERKAGEDEPEPAVNGEKIDDAEQKVDDSEKQEVDQLEEKGVGLEENKEEQDVVAKDVTVGGDQMDNEDEDDGEPAPSSSSSMSSSVASGVVTTIEELQEALAKTGDHKFIASEELTKSHEYKAFMDNFESST